MSKEELYTIKKGDVIGKRFIVESTLGSGAFSVVFDAIDMETNISIALKVSLHRHRHVLYREYTTMTDLMSSGASCVPYVIEFALDGQFCYLAMRKLGLSLRSYISQTLTLPQTMSLGMAAVMVLDIIHQHGYLHRDVKPANLAVDSSRQRLYMIDFGLSRKYVTQYLGKPAPPRTNVGFRGSYYYCSVNAHTEADLTIKDDFYSLLFSLIEIHKGALPWSGVREKSQIEKIKRHAVESGEIFDGLDPVFEKMARVIADLAWGERINVKKMHRLMAPLVEGDAAPVLKVRVPVKKESVFGMLRAMGPDARACVKIGKI
ncbi:Protein kinase domain [Carpediemonas membranifera]|uniref:Protein kinase domain n=1 Tax=Carpediemonas membranifera TaxID=201153 RepID=A0A8J6AWM4_9EUKA|nr:Protein kinase domain [Carpediemonas membranifera]|eukprot:KAG9396013.1 Protein kinase domain [Carpediemonas membranifera]